MSTTRESCFECSYVSDVDRRTALVRAWSAADAERAFRDVLAEEGVREPGDIVVTGIGARREATRPTRHMAH